MNIQSDRINKLRKLLDSDREGLLITNENDIYYLCGMRNTEGRMIITNDSAYLLVDFRYIEAAGKLVSSCEVVEISSFMKTSEEIFKRHNLDTVYIQSGNVTVKDYNLFVSSFNRLGVSVVSDETLDRTLADLRIIKSEDEIELMTKAQRITEKAYTEVLNLVRPGVSERKVALELEYLMKQYGAKEVSFDLITITGKNTSLPHGVPGDTLIKEGDFFTMDIGALYEGYHSDMTRTVAVKSCSDEQREIYEIVRKAQQTALEAVQSGKRACEIDKIARDIITEAGYGKDFGHSTGHGVGLDIHERPFVSAKGDTILRENMVITVEPGIYLKNRFGVRIEDMVLVKDGGFKNFAALTKDLIIV